MNYWNSFCDKWTKRLIIVMQAFKDIDNFDWETDIEASVVVFYKSREEYLSTVPTELCVGNHTIDELDAFEYNITDLEEIIAKYYQEQERLENLARIKKEALAKLTSEEIEVLAEHFTETKPKKRK